MTGFLILLVIIGIGLVVVLPVMLVKRYDEKAAARREQERQAQQRRENSSCEVDLAQSGFKASKVLHFEHHHFAIDDNKKRIAIRTNGVLRFADYKDIVAYEMIDDGQTLTSGGAKNALAGGVLFGVTGAVVGSAMKKTTNVCANMQLRIAVNDVVNPTIVYNLISPPGALKNGVMYTGAFNFAKSICETLSVIQKQGA